MKVLFLFGGLPHYLNKVLNKINAEPAIEVAVIVPSGNSLTFGSGVHQSDEGIDFKVIRLVESKAWYGKPFFKAFYKTIQSEKPDIIVTGWPYFLAYILNPILLFKLKIKGIKLYAREIPFTVPGYRESFADFEKRCVDSQKDELIFKNRAAFFLLKLMRRYLYTTVFKKALLYTEQGVEIINSYGIKKENIIVTYNSPDTDQIFATIKEIKAQYPNIVASRHRLLHIGRLVKWKHVDLLINAVNALKSKYPDIELAIIGKGEEEINLKNQVKALQIEDHVTFLGAIYEGEGQTIEFLKSEVYVLAGMGGLSINEAMAHGLPVVCSVADGTEKGLVFEGQNGFYFKDNNLESLVFTIEKVFESDLKSMGEKSRKVIQEKINLPFVASQFINALKQ
ncbi:MAG: glycosyltransferase [bacterium]|nr:glycosyltransferase [bacterium]